MLLLKKVIANFFTTIALTFAFCISLYLNAIGFAIVFLLFFTASILSFSRLIREAEKQKAREDKRHSTDHTNIWKEFKRVEGELGKISDHLDTLAPKAQTVRPGSVQSVKFLAMQKEKEN